MVEKSQISQDFQRWIRGKFVEIFKEILLKNNRYKTVNFVGIFWANFLIESDWFCTDLTNVFNYSTKDGNFAIFLENDEC